MYGRLGGPYAKAPPPRARRARLVGVELAVAADGLGRGMGGLVWDVVRVQGGWRQA